MERFRAVPVETRLGRGGLLGTVAVWTGLIAVFGVLLQPGATLRAAHATPSLSSSPRGPESVGGCQVFPSNNIWNTDISKLPVHRRSSVWLKSMKASISKLHPAFGRQPYGMPYALLGDFHPKVPIRFEWRDESDPGPYPFGPDIPLEMNEDRHALMVNRDTCTLYELFRADWNRGFPRAGSGAIFNLSSNKLRPDGWTSADAAGLPIFPGLLRYDEVMSGVITHAIRFTTPRTDCRHTWPARHHVKGCSRLYPPMGARFRLKARYSLARFSPPVRVILRAMKRYGLILADNGPNWYIGGTMDPLWTDSILRQLKTVPASAFRVVNASICMVHPSSAAARCP